MSSIAPSALSLAGGGSVTDTACCFTGKAISFLPAILAIRAVLNLQYSVLHSRMVRRGKEYAQVQSLSAISRRVGERLYLDDDSIRAQYLVEVKTCMRMVSEGREYRFVEERHMCIALVQTDAT